MTDQRAEATTRVTRDSDTTWRVEIGYTHLPIRYTLHLEERRESDALQLVCDGVTLEAPGATVRASLIRGLADNFERYEQHARAAVMAFRENGEELAPRPVRRQRELTDEFLADVLRRHAAHRAAGRPPTQTLAAEEGVTVGAVKNWLRKAREAGIGEEE